MKKTIKAILAIILCFTLVLGVFVMSGCDQSDSVEDQSQDKNDDGKDTDKQEENGKVKTERAKRTDN